MGIVQQASGTFSGSSFTPTLPGASSSSNTVCVIVMGNTIINTPTNWTLRTSQVNEAGHYLFERAGVSLTSVAMTNSAGQGTWWIWEVNGAYVTSNSQNAGASLSPTYSTPAITPTAGTRTVFASLGSLTGLATVRTLSGWTNSFVEQIDLCQASSDYPMQGGAILADVTANGSTSYSTTGTYSASSSGRSAIIAAYASSAGGGGTGHTATVALAATTTGTATARLDANLAAALSATAALAASAAVGRNTDASRTATATITATGVVGKPSDAALAATATLTASAQVAKTGTASLAASDTITATAQRDASSGAPLAATDSIAASASLGQSATASLGATDAITATGLVGKVSSADIAATATITATAAATSPGSSTAALAATDTIAASASLGQATTAALAATDSITAAAQVDKAATATIAATDALTATPVVGKTGTAAVAATATLAATATVTSAAIGVTLTASAALTAVAALGRTATANLPGVATLTATGSVAGLNAGTPVRDPRMLLTSAVSDMAIAAGLVGVVRLETARNLAINPSFETAGAAVEVRRNYCLYPVPGATGWPTNAGTGGVVTTTAQFADARFGGGFARKVEWTTGSSAGAFVSVSPGVTPDAVGESWVASFRYQVTGPYAGVVQVNCDTHTANSRGSFDHGDGTKTVWLVLTSVSTVTRAPYLFLTTAVPTGTVLLVGEALIEKIPVRMPWFDGDYSPDSDMTAAWTGTANASQSKLSAPSVVNGGVGSTVDYVNIQSVQWTGSGTKSLRCIPRAVSGGASFSQLAGSSGGLSGFGITFVPGKTYTAIATCRVPVAQTGSLSPNARKLRVLANSGGGNVDIAVSNQGAAIGTTELRVTFTVPAAATSCYILAYNGANAGNGDVWFDNFLLVEGTYTGGYFDGSTGRFNEWAGIPHASQSILLHDFGLGDTRMTLTTTPGEMEIA